MDFETILYSVEDGVGQIRFNRGDTLNAFNRTMIEETRSALRQAAKDDAVRAVVLTGEGRGFSAGADLASRDPVDPGMSRGDVVAKALDEGFNPMGREIAGFPKPTVAAVNGVTAGGGVGVALACDLVVAGKSAYFVQVFGPRLGLVPDVGCTWLLPRLVGRARARGLALLGDRLPADKAAEWGLIWECVDDADMMATALGYAKRLAKGPTLAFSRIKKILDESERNMLAEQLALERDFQRDLGNSDDNAEGVRAFLEKREPVFKGR